MTIHRIFHSFHNFFSIHFQTSTEGVPVLKTTDQKLTVDKTVVTFLLAPPNAWTGRRL